MGRPVVLLIGTADGDSDWVDEMQAFCTVHRARSSGDLNGRIKLLCPHAVCFEFNQHDPEGLALLLRTRQTHPSLPILMITEEHSEELAVWALRTRVWDYFVKPVLVKELYCSIMKIHGLKDANAPLEPRMRRPNDKLLARSSAADGRSRAEATVEKVRAYIARHLSEKISETELADHCAMSYFHFSRTFRRVTGVTLREYILRERIDKAAQLLSASPGISITAACYETGFHDLSYFARMFRRYKGVTPSEYRQAALASAGPTPSPVRVLYAVQSK